MAAYILSLRLTTTTELTNHCAPLHHLDLSNFCATFIFNIQQSAVSDIVMAGIAVLYDG